MKWTGFRPALTAARPVEWADKADNPILCLTAVKLFWGCSFSQNWSGRESHFRFFPPWLPIIKDGRDCQRRRCKRRSSDRWLDRLALLSPSYTHTPCINKGRAMQKHHGVGRLLSLFSFLWKLWQIIIDIIPRSKNVTKNPGFCIFAGTIITIVFCQLWKRVHSSMLFVSK